MRRSSGPSGGSVHHKQSGKLTISSVVLLLICFLARPIEAKYSGGTGDPNDPYHIATAEDLIALGETPEDYDKHFIMTANIDLDPYLPGGKVFDRAIIAPDVKRMPWGIEGTPFTGVFDGNGYTISYLTVNGPGCLGLFGWLSGEVKDLGVVRVNISGSEYGVAGLVGANSGTIADCHASGTVSGSMGVGGLVGQNGVRIGNRFDALVFSGSIKDSYSNCDVMGVTYVGGLIGFNYAGKITRCYSSGAVLDNEPNQPFDPQEGFFGGLIGYSHIFGIEDGFWDIDASGLTVSDGGTGKTTAQMQTAATFLEAGWDFADETANGPNDIWKISESLDYPRLWWEKYGGGTGEPNNPYLIYKAEHLNGLGAERNDYNKHFKLMADIDLSGYLYDRAVIAPDMIDSGLQHEGKPFTGVLDGNGHAILNLTIEGNSFLGLFGYLDSDAIVSNLSIEAADVKGISDFVGSLAGFSYGNIIGCCCSGDVSGNDDVGGLLGSNTIGGNIANCYSTVTVNGNEKVGGLVGYTKGSVTTCYSTGMVISQGQNAGGLVGERDPSYGIVADCFWDAQTSGQATSAGGTGETTAEMQMAATFLEQGWDWMDETANGAEDIWWILEGQGYPRLWWEAAGQQNETAD